MERTLSYVEAVREATDQEMEADPSVFVFGLDVDDPKAIQGTTRGLATKYGPERVFGTPLSEDAMTGVAIGAALAGMRPIHVHIRMDFLMLAMNQLVNVAAKSRYMYGGQVHIPLVIRSMIGKSWGQGAQHSQSLYAFFMHVPGLKVVTYSNPTDGYGLVRTALRDENPVVFLDHKALFAAKGDAPAEGTVIPFGQARICREGKDVTLVAVAMMVPRALEAVEQLAAEASVEVIDPRTLAPLDTAAIFASVEKTGRLLIVDEAYPTCSFASEVAALVARERLYELDAPIRTLNARPVPHPLSPPLEEATVPQVADIVAAVRALMED